MLLIVNTASQCGFTPQFEGLEALYQKYAGPGPRGAGLSVATSSAHQDPGTNDEIGAFCTENYGVSFPMMEKIDVNGADAAPLYKWLVKEAPGLLGSTAIKWNFTKFLVGRDGRVGQALCAARQARVDRPRHRGGAAGRLIRTSKSAVLEPEPKVTAWLLVTPSLAASTV